MVGGELRGDKCLTRTNLDDLYGLYERGDFGTGLSWGQEVSGREGRSRRDGLKSGGRWR